MADLIATCPVCPGETHEVVWSSPRSIRLAVTAPMCSMMGWALRRGGSVAIDCGEGDDPQIFMVGTIARIDGGDPGDEQEAS